MNSEEIGRHCRGEKIGKFREVFEIFELLTEQMAQPSFLLKISPRAILQHLRNVDSFTK